MRTTENEEQYEDALARAYNFVQLTLLPESKEYDELEILKMLIKEYEHHPIL